MMKLNGGDIARNYLGKAQKHFGKVLGEAEMQENSGFGSNRNNGNARVDKPEMSYEEQHEALRSHVTQCLEAKDYESAHKALGMHMDSMKKEGEGEKDLAMEKGVSEQKERMM